MNESDEENLPVKKAARMFLSDSRRKSDCVFWSGGGECFILKATFHQHSLSLSSHLSLVSLSLAWKVP